MEEEKKKTLEELKEHNPEDRIAPGSNLKWKHVHHITHEDAVKAGSAKTIKKTNASRMRFIKERGLRLKDIPWLYQRLEDPKSNLLHIMILLDKLVVDSQRDKSYTPALKQKLVDLHIQAHKIMHGTSVNISGGVTVNIADQIADRIVDKIIDADFVEVKDTDKDNV